MWRASAVGGNLIMTFASARLGKETDLSSCGSREQIRLIVDSDAFCSDILPFRLHVLIVPADPGIEDEINQHYVAKMCAPITEVLP